MFRISIRIRIRWIRNKVNSLIRIRFLTFLNYGSRFKDCFKEKKSEKSSIGYKILLFTIRPDP